jgi:hypothetical protein
MFNDTTITEKNLTINQENNDVTETNETIEKEESNATLDESPLKENTVQFTNYLDKSILDIKTINFDEVDKYDDLRYISLSSFVSSSSQGSTL